MKLIVFLILAFPMGAFAQSVTLKDYLVQVRAANPQARALAESIRSLELKDVESEASTATIFYVEAGIKDDQSEVLMPAMGRRTEGHGWKLGLRKQFTTGTSADLYYDSHW